MLSTILQLGLNLQNNLSKEICSLYIQESAYLMSVQASTLLKVLFYYLKVGGQEKE